MYMLLPAACEHRSAVGLYCKWRLCPEPPLLCPAALHSPCRCVTFELFARRQLLPVGHSLADYESRVHSLTLVDMSGELQFFGCGKFTGQTGVLHARRSAVSCTQHCARLPGTAAAPTSYACCPRNRPCTHPPGTGVPMGLEQPLRQMVAPVVGARPPAAAFPGCAFFQSDVLLRALKVRVAGSCWFSGAYCLFDGVCPEQMSLLRPWLPPTSPLTHAYALPFPSVPGHHDPAGAGAEGRLLARPARHVCAV